MTKEVNIVVPDDTIKVNVNGADREIFMSAGLMQKIAMIAEAHDDFSLIYMDPLIQERCFIEVLVERDNRGVPIEDTSELSMMAFEMNMSDSNKLSKWIGDHAVNFFVSGARNMKNSVQAQQEVFENLTQSLIGTNASTQTKQSVGPSTPPEVE